MQFHAPVRLRSCRNSVTHTLVICPATTMNRRLPPRRSQLQSLASPCFSIQRDPRWAEITQRSGPAHEKPPGNEPSMYTAPFRVANRRGYCPLAAEGLARYHPGA